MPSPLNLSHGDPKSERKGIAYLALPLCPPSLNLTLVKDCYHNTGWAGHLGGGIQEAEVGRERIQGPASPFRSLHVNLS